MFLCVLNIVNSVYLNNTIANLVLLVRCTSDTLSLMPKINKILTSYFITEISPYRLGNFRKFILNIIFELSSKQLQKYFIHLKTYIN